MVSTPIREMTKNSPIPPPTCPPELVFAFYQIELSEDSRISLEALLLFLVAVARFTNPQKIWVTQCHQLRLILHDTTK